MISPSDLANPSKLEEIQKETFQRMAQEVGLTLAEAEPLFEDFNSKVRTAMDKFKRAQMQASRELAARLQERARYKEKHGS